MRHYCGWCQTASDWIDLDSTKCEHCTQLDLLKQPRLVHVQTNDGVLADRRGRALRESGEAKRRMEQQGQ